MTTPAWMKQLEAQINRKIASALQNEIAETVKHTMSDVIQDVTFKQYTPEEYIRREEQGKLGLSSVENMDMEVVDDNTISIKNVTRGNTKYPGSTSDMIDEIIVSGIGYTWEDSDIYQKQPYPRDFYEDTREELRNTNNHVAALSKGLKRQNIDVRR